MMSQYKIITKVSNEIAHKNITIFADIWLIFNIVFCADFKTSMKRILTNKILIFNSASNSFFVLGLIGYWTFMPKYMETQFRQTAAYSNFASGAIGILSSGLGIVTSGVIISKFKPSPRALALWNFVTEFLEVLGHLAYIFLGCARDDLHGQWNADQTLVSKRLYNIIYLYSRLNQCFEMILVQNFVFRQQYL